jgi:hypothetical protein
MLGDADTDPDVHLLVASMHVAEHLMRRHEGLDADADWNRHGERSLAWLGASEDDLDDWAEDLQPAFEST